MLTHDQYLYIPTTYIYPLPIRTYIYTYAPQCWIYGIHPPTYQYKMLTHDQYFYIPILTTPTHHPCRICIMQNLYTFWQLFVSELCEKRTQSLHSFDSTAVGICRETRPVSFHVFTTIHWPFCQVSMVVVKYSICMKAYLAAIVSVLFNWLMSS